MDLLPRAPTVISMRRWMLRCDEEKLPTLLLDVQGEITRARAHHLNYQVASFLGGHLYSMNYMALPKPSDIILRNQGSLNGGGGGNPKHGDDHTTLISSGLGLNTLKIE
ncbi:hypothetical protein GUJ93_ZPchr0006g44641 [Zizania palustris]|uniref:Uncharacterized protein n=1 Tax=Zizania palustris TaxID=103762 RepID=A0A8J5SJ46_ZIZPA|nr:hypothetical protein GUJ93_ZPchr0006g44641 [Zizania palustris]